MRLVAIGLMLMLAASGCARNKGGAGQSTPKPGNQKLIVTPATGLTGKVVRVNLQARFVVLNFPIGHLPALDQRLNVYRLGLKIGEIRVTGPHLDDNIVADIMVGEAQAGDEVRDR